MSFAPPTDAPAGELGRPFAEALARKDFAAIAAVLDPAIDFRALTPGRAWEADRAATVVADILPVWFDENDHVDAIESIDTDAVSDRRRVAYRFRGHNADGPFVVEQQAYYTEQAGRINWMRVLCSGYRPG